MASSRKPTIVTVLLDPAAETGLSKLQRRFQEQVQTKIDGLQRDPYPPGAIKLHGVWGRYSEEAYRIRSGNYRILYVVRGQAVVVVEIGDRKDVYE